MVSSAGAPRARSLAAMLRTARDEKSVSARELARQLGKAHTTIQRWESGETMPNAEDVSAYLACLGIVGDDRERIMTLARGNDEGDWLASGQPGISQQLAGVMECERKARRMTEWAPLVIPGVLQSGDYVRSIIGASGKLSASDVQTRVMFRLARRDALTRLEPVHFTALIGEPAVTGRIGGRAVMVDQLRQVLRMAERDNVTVQVVSVSGNWHPGHAGPFILYEFDENQPPILYLEHHRSGAFLVDADDVEEYRHAVNLIRRGAMSAEESAALIADVITTLETTE